MTDWGNAVNWPELATTCPLASTEVPAKRLLKCLSVPSAENVAPALAPDWSFDKAKVTSGYERTSMGPAETAIARREQRAMIDCILLDVGDG